MIAVALSAVAIFVFIYLGWVYGLIVVLGAVVSACLMLLFKHLQEENDPNKPHQGDFINNDKK